MQNLETQKYELIYLIMQLDSPQILQKMVQLAMQKDLKEEVPAYHNAVKPLRKGLNLGQIAAEQNYKGFSWKEFCALRTKLAITETAEELIALI